MHHTVGSNRGFTLTGNYVLIIPCSIVEKGCHSTCQMQQGLEICLLPLLSRVTGLGHFTIELSTVDPVPLKFLAHAKPAAYHDVFTPYTIQAHAHPPSYTF